MLQVLKRHYGPEADIWSCGVILYILLSGVPPFWGETEQQIFDSILKGHIDFHSDPWPSISSGAKNAVKAMLQQARPRQFFTSFQEPYVQCQCSEHSACVRLTSEQYLVFLVHGVQDFMMSDEWQTFSECPA